MKYLAKEDKFKELIKEGKILVDFYADWCGPCQMLTPILEQLEKKDKEIKVIKVNTDEFMELANEYKIMSIPALKLFENGKLIKETVGYMSLEELEDFIK